MTHSGFNTGVFVVLLTFLDCFIESVWSVANIQSYLLSLHLTNIILSVCLVSTYLLSNFLSSLGKPFCSS
jgi:hypothetical protein